MSKPAVYMRVVAFCHSAPKAHIMNVTILVEVFFESASMAGNNQSGPWSASINMSG